MKAFVGKLQKKVDRKALGGGGEGESVRMSTGNKARKAALDSCVASVTYKKCSQMQGKHAHVH